MCIKYAKPTAWQTLVRVRFENFNPTRPIGLSTPNRPDPIAWFGSGRFGLNPNRCAVYILGWVSPGWGLNWSTAWQPMVQSGLLCTKLTHESGLGWVSAKKLI